MRRALTRQAAPPGPLADHQREDQVLQRLENLHRKQQGSNHPYVVAAHRGRSYARIDPMIHPNRPAEIYRSVLTAVDLLVTKLSART